MLSQSHDGYTEAVTSYLNEVAVIASTFFGMLSSYCWGCYIYGF